MPELPEVETVCRGLARTLQRARVDAVELFRSDLRWPIPTAAVRALVGRRLCAIERRSKYLLLRFDGRPATTALIHLGMSGRLFISPLPARRLPERLPHEHWRMRFGRRLLRYVDPRRFGMLDVVNDARAPQHRLLVGLGPEPLDPIFDGAFLHAITRGKKAPIKSFLMDAKNVVGVGNIYATEALFRARVRPTRAAHRLSRVACEELADAVRTTLREAVTAGGTTLRDYIGVDERSGRFQQQLAVYGRAGEPCPRCQAAVHRIVLAGRSTFYCRRCQK